MVEKIDERGLASARDPRLTQSEEYPNQRQAIGESAVSLTRIHAVDTREIFESGTSGVQLVSEHQRVIGKQIGGGSREPLAHPAKNRKVEQVTVVCNAYVTAAELAECGPDLFKERS